MAIIVLLLGAGGYYVYVKYVERWVKPFTAAIETAKAPYAVKEVMRHASNGPATVSVQIIDDKRWRVEARGLASGVVVAICDGSNSVSNLPGAPASNLDPRPALVGILSAATAFAGIAPMNPHIVTEQYEGHTCWKIPMANQGLPVNLWVDSTTGVPVCLYSSGGTQYLEIHFTKLPIDFSNPDTGEFFDTTRRAPFFTNYLTL